MAAILFPTIITTRKVTITVLTSLFTTSVLTSYFIKVQGCFIEVDAAEKLNDFYLLVPELYGESACTHNVHFLSHICKYLHLWGPLWMHSLFGYESKNGQIKHLQLLFNVDILLTLQLVRHHLSTSQVANFIGQVKSSQSLAT